MSINGTALLKALVVGIVLAVVLGVVVGMVAGATGNLPNNDAVRTGATPNSAQWTIIIVNAILYGIAGAMYTWFAKQERDEVPHTTGQYTLGGALTGAMLGLINAFVPVIVGMFRSAPVTLGIGVVLGAMVLGAILGAIGGAVYGLTDRHHVTTAM